MTTLHFTIGDQVHVLYLPETPRAALEWAASIGALPAWAEVTQ